MSIEQLREAFEASTAGKWEVHQQRAYRVCNSDVTCDEGYVVARAFSSPSSHITHNELWAECEGNTNFIALAHNHMADLLKAVQLLKDAREFAQDYDDDSAHGVLCGDIVSRLLERLT